MLTQYNLKMPHAVYGGENAMDNITAIIKARGAKKVAMFTDKGIEGAGLFALPEEAVKAYHGVLQNKGIVPVLPLAADLEIINPVLRRER